jgi:hypothetical protein
MQMGGQRLPIRRPQVHAVEDGQRAGCSPRCWCKRPILSTFRWVFPFKHTPADTPATD